MIIFLDLDSTSVALYLAKTATIFIAVALPYIHYRGGQLKIIGLSQWSA
jgi:hypothetical protein